MSEMSSGFSREEIQILIDAIDDWENIGVGEWNIVKMIKDAPMPPEDHDAYEAFKAAKEHFREREVFLRNRKDDRAERAVFIKAKLFMVRKKLDIDSLFEMPVESSPAPVVKEKSISGASADVKEYQRQLEDYIKKLEMAEYFIKDLGVEKHYRKFIEEKAEKV